jgi:hypothetical protein
MLEAAKAGTATLFVNFVDRRPASYLFCGEYAGMAFGWSQANDPSFTDSGQPLRHLLEWQAMLEYRRRGFAFYDLGDRPFPLQYPNRPSSKELSIAEFKERFGGFLLPKVHWRGHADASVLASELSAWGASVARASAPSLSEGIP